MQGSIGKVSTRKAAHLEEGRFNDRNDGYCRTLFSRSKNNNSKNTKRNKLARVKPLWKQ